MVKAEEVGVARQLQECSVRKVAAGRRGRERTSSPSGEELSRRDDGARVAA